MFTRAVSIAILLAAFTAYASAQPPSDGIPHLAKVGGLTHLMVDGKPFLIFGGELRNSSTSSLEYMKPIWPRMAADKMNTLLAPVSWELVEPQEGKLDFALVDGMIAAAQENHLHLVFLWFGSWKNGESVYTPAWVKSDLKRFPRAQDQQGGNLEILSAFSTANRDADAHAFAALMKHIREVDGSKHTVLMMQVENESGVLGSPRDFSPGAEAAWKNPVPDALLSFLTKNRGSLQPELLEVWRRTGFRSSGTWAEVFGTTQKAGEIFEAWQYSQYIDAVAAAGKAEYPIPMYVNAWLTQYTGEPGGEHPSGGAVSRVLDVWLAGISHIDVLAPDIYLPDLREVLSSYDHLGNPLFIPETRGGETGGANALYAFGQGVFGFSPFAVDSSNDNEPLALAYGALNQLAPLLTSIDRPQMTSVVRQAGDTRAAVELGGYLLRIQYQQGPQIPGPPQRENMGVPSGAAIIINTAPDEFVIAGEGLTVTFLPDSQGPQHVELMNVEEGTFDNGTWMPERRLNGDETNGGNYLIFRGAAPTTQKVRLYRHD
ncbi:MAG: DUF5597 domain-containing protein [Terracidiphilus sp.]|nr:DUF5597 domain-containing protein [Terracidiphilus sp.]